MVLLKKKAFSLLEVMIAIALIVFCVIPLISPHVFIYKAQNAFVDRVQLDHLVNNLYGDVVEQLHHNQIPWDAIVSDTSFPVTAEAMSHVHFNERLPYKGSYAFKVTKYKPDEPPDLFTVYLLKLKFTFTPMTPTASKAKPIEYLYDLFVVRDQLQGGA